MNEKYQNALLGFIWTTITTLAALKLVPSQMTAAGWLDALYPAVVSGVLAGLGTFVVQQPPAQKLLGRRP